MYIGSTVKCTVHPITGIPQTRQVGALSQNRSIVELPHHFKTRKLAKAAPKTACRDVYSTMSSNELILMQYVQIQPMVMQLCRSNAKFNPDSYSHAETML